MLDWFILEANFIGNSKDDCTGDGACWVFIKVWFNRFMYGLYPDTEQWRINTAFLILFAFGIGIGFLRNNLKKSFQDESIAEKPLIAKDKNQKPSEIDIIQEIKKNPSSKLNSISEKSTSIISNEFKELNTASPSLEDIRNLINGWLLNKSNYLAGKDEINLSKIVSKGLIDRTIQERQNDIKKGIYKQINSQIRKIDLESQTSSRIVVLVELNYLERLVKNSGEFVNETSLNPLKVKYI